MNKNEKQLLLGTLVVTSVLVVINIILLSIIFSKESEESSITQTSSTSSTSNTIPSTEESVSNEEIPSITDIDEAPPAPSVETPVSFVAGEVTSINGRRITIRDFDGNSSEVNTSRTTTYTTSFTEDFPDPSFDSIQTSYFVSVECESASEDCNASAIQITPVIQDED